jgi:hypothetical protein
MPAPEKTRFTEMKQHSIKKVVYFVFFFFVCGSFFITDAFFNSANATDPFGRSELEDTTRTLEIAKSIRDAIQMPNCRKAAEILEDISTEKNIETSTGDKKCKVIKYTNKEISDAVADMFLRTWNMKGRDNWFLAEDEPGWFSDLQIYAESTFSPKLYAYEVFSTPLGTKNFRHTLPRGRCMVAYLSNVNTSETLQIILNSYFDPPNRSSIALTYLPSKQQTHIDLCAAMEIFAGICKSDPQSMRKESENVRAFIRKNIDHYVKNKTIVLGDETTNPFDDFRARYAAIDVLGFYANPADKDWIQKIANESLSVQTNEKGECFPAAKIQAKARGILQENFKAKK